MATQTEKQIHELTVEIALLKERVETLRSEAVPYLKMSTDIAVIQAQLAEMTKSKELWAQRGWAFLTVCVSSLLSLVVAILGTLLTFYLNTKK